MAGIVSYGAYVPYNRLSRALIAKVWEGRGGGAGEKAVAGYDEDSLTMAVAAARDCLKDTSVKGIDAVYFASTTPPYQEKQMASTIATVLNLDSRVFTVDFAGSLRSGTNALRAALDAVNSGSARNVLICAADIRVGYPNGDNEMAFGDGAAAFIVGRDSTILSLDTACTTYNEVMDVWRSDEDRYVHTWETGFSYGVQFRDVVSQTVKTALKDSSLTPQDFAKAALYAPDARQLGQLAGALGLDRKTQVIDLHATIGNTGTALALMSLVAALEETAPGDRILMASYGDGCDVFVFKVTGETRKNHRGIKGNLAVERMMPSYEKYLLWRGLIEVEPPRRLPFTRPSAVALWRDNKAGLAFYGVKCKKCGTPQYPPQRVCIHCRGKDEFEEYSFADKIGKVVNYSHDYLGATLDPPITIATVDFEEGGRVRLDMVDREMEEVKVGTKVEMTFRKVRDAGSIHDYWWKCRPVRG